MRHNDLGTAVLLRELAETGFAGRLVLASSMSVYGEGGYRCSDHGPVAPLPRAREDLAAARFAPRCPECRGELEPVAVPESAPADPANVYAATKLHQEQLCAIYGRETGVSVTALRYHNVYGPRMPPDTPYSGVAAIFATAVAAGRTSEGVRGWRPAARLHPCPRRGSGKRDRTHWRRGPAGGLQRGQREPPLCGRDGSRSHGRRGGGRSPTGGHR